MNILATQYTLANKSLDIYVAGCTGSPHCIGCHNKESWDFNQGEIYNEGYFKRLKLKIEKFDILIDNIMIFGGEPNDQKYGELLYFLTGLSTLNKKIWLFTRYNIEYCTQFELSLCDYIKCGAYIPELTTENNVMYGIKLATSNQHIYKKGLDY